MDYAFDNLKLEFDHGAVEPARAAQQQLQQTQPQPPQLQQRQQQRLQQQPPPSQQPQLTLPPYSGPSRALAESVVCSLGQTTSSAPAVRFHPDTPCSVDLRLRPERNELAHLSLTNSELFEDDEKNLPATSSTFDRELPNQSSSSYLAFPYVSSGQASLSDCSTGVVYGSGLLDPSDIQRCWNINYHEAAIYLQEGLNNDKFDLHPKTKQALPLYLIVHNHYFYIMDLVASLVLLLLTFAERPAVAQFELPVALHASLELLALIVILIELIVKFWWMGLPAFCRHTRSSIKLVTLLIMLAEAFCVLARMDSHFRVTRALRPVFLIDNHYCGGIRRVIRQIIQSMPPILDMLVLLFFFILIFALCGFYLFSTNPADPYFQTLEKSFVSLFVLLTTANYPDVMLPSYSKARISSLFFVVYLIISLYFLMNLMLAVVYETFTRIEKDKFRKLLLHRRQACKHAFKLLVSKSMPELMPFKHFHGVVSHYQPQLSKLNSYLVFKTLDTERRGRITLEQFYAFYEVVDLNWKRTEQKISFYITFKPDCLVDVLNRISALVRTTFFDYLVYLCIFCSSVWQLYEVNWHIKNHLNVYDNLINLETSYVTMLFITLFTVEMLMKIIAHGLDDYLQDGWNCFDFIVTNAAILGLIAYTFDLPFAFVYILRSVRLLKLFELKNRYRDIMGTFMFILLKRFVSVFIVVLIVYYFFAIIGMELFGQVNLRDCCKGTELESYFRSGQDGGSAGYYYLNSFDNILFSFVTLFQLMVANNWHIIMGGYSENYSEWSRLYFMTFYIITMVVITIVVAFVLEAFLFRIQYKKKMGDIDKDTKVIFDVSITQQELNFCVRPGRFGQTSDRTASQNNMFRFSEMGGRLPSNDIDTIHTFHGERTRTKFLFSLKMYSDELREWIQNDESLVNEEIEENLKQTLGISRHSRRTYSCSY